MQLTKIERKKRIKYRIRKIVKGTADRPRMAVYRSNKNIYVQFIDDLAGATLASASSKDKTLETKISGLSGTEAAKLVGELSAQKAKEKGITSVVFDRGGHLYHGRIKFLADAARESGLKF